MTRDSIIVRDTTGTASKHRTSICFLQKEAHPFLVPLSISRISAFPRTLIFIFIYRVIKFNRIDVICYGAEPMELRCGASQSSGCCPNRQSTVKVQQRESEVRGLVVLPGLPVFKGSSARDERAPGLLSIPPPTDKEAVCANNSNRHPNPHMIHHLGISAVPLAYQVGGKPPLGIQGLPSRNSINRIYHRCKVLPHLQTGLKVFIRLLLLVL
jgi:hypothetical protein